MRKIVMVVLLGLAGFACADDGAEDLTATQGPSETTEATEAPEATDGAYATYTDSEFTAPIAIDEFSFAPATIKAPGAAKATLELHNEGDATHTFTIDSLDVDEELEPGAERTVTIDDLGTETRVEYYCRFHVGSQDMKGSFSLH